MLRYQESSTVLSAIFELLIQFSWQKSVNKQQKKVVLFSACFSKCRSAAEVLWSFPLCNQTQSFVFDVDQISSLLSPGNSLSLHTKWCVTLFVLHLIYFRARWWTPLTVNVIPAGFHHQESVLSSALWSNWIRCVYVRSTSHQFFTLKARGRKINLKSLKAVTLRPTMQAPTSSWKNLVSSTQLC